MTKHTSPEQIVSVCEELEHLMITWPKGELEEREIRAGSAILRRLFIYNELNRVWNILIGEERFIIPARIIVIDHQELLHLYDLYTCSVVKHKGMTTYETMAYLGQTKMVPVGEGKFKDATVYGAHIEQVDLNLNQFLESTCMIAEGRPISRSWAIQYVAHSLGGTHFGSKKKKKDPKFDIAMTKLRKFDVGSMPASVVETLGIGQALCQSPSTEKLLSAYASWRKENPHVRIA